MLITGFMIALLLAPGANQAGGCNDFAFKKLLKGPRSEFRGRYVNEPYQYSVVIPKGLTGYDVPGPANHEGFGLALGKPLQSYVFVRGEHNSFEYNTPREAAERSLEYLHRDGKNVESETITLSHLGRLDAVRLVSIYSCPGSSDRYVLDSTMAISPDKGFLYEIDLYSPANRYETDRAVLSRILKSWKMMPGPRHNRGNAGRGLT